MLMSTEVMAQLSEGNIRTLAASSVSVLLCELAADSPVTFMGYYGQWRLLQCEHKDSGTDQFVAQHNKHPDMFSSAETQK